MKCLNFKNTVWSLFMSAAISGCASVEVPEIKKEPFFVSVIRFSPSELDLLEARLRKQYKETGLKYPALNLGFRPAGMNPQGKNEANALAFRELKKRLEGSGIEPGFLVQNTFGHGWPGQPMPGQNWSTTVTIGGVDSGRQCPFEEEFRKYIVNAFITFAKEKPAFFLVDDDFRLNNNGTDGLQCFCKKCVAEMNRRSGLNETPEQWMKRIKTLPGTDPTVKIYKEFRDEVLLSFAREIRKGIDSVDPAIRCGYCSGGGEIRFMEEVTKAFAGNTKPFLRIHNAMYMERDAKLMPERVYHTAMMKKYAGDIEDLLDESDTCNHSRFAKSAISMHAHIVMGILNGLTGGKLWLHKGEDIRVRNAQEYFDILGKHQKFYPALMAEMANLKREGALTLLPAFSKDDSPVSYRDFFFYKDWQYEMLYRYGIPARYTGNEDKNTVYLLSGDFVKGYSDAELKKILSAKVLCDGSAAIELTKRGFAKYIGVDGTDEHYSISYEKYNDIPVRMSLMRTPGTPLLKPNSDKTEWLSKIILADFGQPDKIQGPGAVRFVNELGGEVITIALRMGDDGANIYNLFSPTRKDMAVYLLEKLGGKLPVYAAADQDIYLICGQRPDKSRLVAMINLNYDGMPEIALKTADRVSAVFELAPDGTYKKLDAEISDNEVRIKKTLASYEAAVLILKY